LSEARRAGNLTKPADERRIGIMSALCSKAAAMALAIAGLTACATPPPAEFQPVTQAGARFAQSVPPLLDAALNEAIAANSATLVMDHASASEDARKTALLEANSASRERKKIFADVGNHARLLKAYSWRWRRWPTPAAPARSPALQRA
jgi:hypothetical protein